MIKKITLLALSLLFPLLMRSQCLGIDTASVTYITYDTATLNWATFHPAAHYDVYVILSETYPDANTIPNGSVTATTASLSNLQPGTTYYWWIRANCGTSTSGWTYCGNFTTYDYLPCTTGYLHPQATFTPSYTGSPELIDDLAFAGDYSVVNYKHNRLYTFSTSRPGDYITIVDTSNGVVRAHGVAPISWYSDYDDGMLKFYCHTIGCGTDNTPRNKYITCSANTVSCPPPTTTWVVPVASNLAEFHWTSPATVNSGYDYYVSTSSVAPFADATPTGNTPNTEMLLTFNANTTYYWWVRSNCGIYQSTWTYGGLFRGTGNYSPCTNGGLYPQDAFTPSYGGSPQAIATDSWAGEFSLVNILANRQYVFSSSSAGDLVTITNYAGTVIYAFGTTPFTWASGPVTGTIRYYLHLPGCQPQEQNRTRFITSGTTLIITEPDLNKTVKLFPNPAKGYFDLDTGTQKADRIVLSDNLGRIVKTVNPSSEQTRIEVSGFAAGIYYVRLMLGNEEVVKKVVIE